MTIGRDPQAETRTRRALDGVLVVINSLIQSGDLVLDGPSHYRLVPSPLVPHVVLFGNEGGDGDLLPIPGPPGPAGPAGATGASGAGGGVSVYNPDIPPSSPHANDDEFSDGSLGAAWTDWDVGGVMAYTEGSYGAKMVGTGVAGDSLAGIFRACPAGDFSVITKLSLAGLGTNFTVAGIFVAEDLAANPSTGDVILFAPHYENTNSFHLRVNRYTAYNTFGSTLLDTTLAGHASLYLRIRRISTTQYYDYSTDGLNWVNAFSHSAPFTASKVGLCIDNSTHAGVDDAVAYFRFWRQLDTTALDQPLLGGFTSTQGATGPQGAIGMPGLDGSPGEDAMPVPGPQGVAGANGATGAQGPTGLPLFILEDGPPGTDGIPGRNGIDGATGSTGTTGAQGPTGPALFILEDGPPGEDGVPGRNGTNGTNGTNGVQGPAGPATHLLADSSEGETSYVLLNATIPPGSSGLRGQIDGLILSAAGSSTTLTYGAGVCRDGGDSYNLALAAGTKVLASTWAAGSGANGLDTGSPATSTWYHVWVIAKGDGTAADILLSLSATAPTMPTGYSLNRRIGSVKSDGSSNVTAFNQDGNQFSWVVPVNDVTASAPGTAAVTRTLTVPTGVRVEAVLTVAGFDNNVAGGGTGIVYVSDLSTSDVTPGAGSAATLGQGSSATLYAAILAYVWTNTSAQVRSRCQLSTANARLYIVTLGWIDQRGRNA